MKTQVPEPTTGKDEKSPLERMADLTRRVVAVPKAELPKQRPTKRTKGA